MLFLVDFDRIFEGHGPVNRTYSAPRRVIFTMLEAIISKDA